MYNYRDTTDHTKGVADLPAEAVKINGAFIEHVIPGYRTLAVSGRESLSAELKKESAGRNDGSLYVSKRYPERKITVKYQLLSKDHVEFRKAYNNLAEILDVENAQIIFNDEADKYFIGTPADFSEVETGRDNVVGSFSIICTDPHKYALKTKKYTYRKTGSNATAYVAEMLNEGNRPVHPVIRVKTKDVSDLQYDESTGTGAVSTINNDGELSMIRCCADESVIVFGGGATGRLKTYNNLRFSGGDWDGVSDPTNRYKKNTDTVSGWDIGGALNKIEIDVPVQTDEGDIYAGDVEKKYGFGLDYGTSTLFGAGGPTLSFVPTFAATGGAVECELIFMLSEITDQLLDLKQTGEFRLIAVGSSGTNIEVIIRKTTSGRTAEWVVKAGGETKSGEFEMNKDYFCYDTPSMNKRIPGTLKHIHIPAKRSDRLIRISKKKVYVCGHEINIKTPTGGTTNKIIMCFGNAQASSYRKMGIMCVTHIRCEDMWTANATRHILVGQELEVDTDKAEYTLDNGHLWSWGDIANDFAGFTLPPGKCGLYFDIGLLGTQSSENVPTVEVEFRERWI